MTVNSTNRRLNVVWLVVVVITVIYLWIDHTAEVDGTPVSSTAVTGSTIVLALVKYRIIPAGVHGHPEGPAVPAPRHRPGRRCHRRVVAGELLRRAGSRLCPTKRVRRGPEPTEAQWRLIHAALKLFAEHGVGRTSLRMIASELGVTVAAVYHQYNAKDEIICAAVDSELRRLEAVVRAAEAEPTASAARDVLVAGLVDLSVTGVGRSSDCVR